MKALNDAIIGRLRRIGPRFLPFADAASPELPLGRLIRLALFQVSVGLATVLLVGTLNRVMIVELGVAAWLVALMVALPIVAAPFRALIGFRSDHHRSAFGVRRVPFIWTGTCLQFGGFSFMPFAIFILSGDTTGPIWVGHVFAALAFLMVGAGLHTTQTAGLALASDLAPPDKRPRVVALMYVMLLVGMVVSGFVVGILLADFTNVRFIQVIQGAAVVTLVINVIALWKQEPRRARRPDDDAQPRFADAWRRLTGRPGTQRFLVVVALGTLAFNMQDIILEPYGAEVLGLGVGATTALTALAAAGALVAFAMAARALGRGWDPHRLSAMGVLVGLVAFSSVILAAPLGSSGLFRVGVVLIGFGGGLFAVSTMTAAMDLDRGGESGLVLGAWGAVQATAAGLAIASGGVLRDLFADLASHGLLGAALAGPAGGYTAVYHLELLLLFVTLAAIGPLVRHARDVPPPSSSKFGLAELPG